MAPATPPRLNTVMPCSRPTRPGRRRRGSSGSQLNAEIHRRAGTRRTPPRARTCPCASRRRRSSRMARGRRARPPGLGKLASAVDRDVPSAAAARLELGPSFRPARRGSGEIPGSSQHEGERRHDRNDAAEHEQRAPAKCRQRGNRDETRQRRAERNADDGEGDREGAARAGTYSAASAAAFGIAPPRPMPATSRSDGERADAAGRRDRQRRHAEDAPCTTRSALAAPEPIAGDAGDRAADHHAQIAQRDDRREGAPRDAPVRHDRRDRHAEQLVVDAVENDRQRGQEHEPPLVAAPADLDRSARPASSGGLGQRSSTRHRRSSARSKACFVGAAGYRDGVRPLAQLHRHPGLCRLPPARRAVPCRSDRRSSRS